MQRFSSRSRARCAWPRRPRSFRASLEAVEDRTLLSTLSAISWHSGGVEHNAVFAIGANNAVYMDKDSTGFVSLGNYVLQISAGLDWYGNPVIYGIGGNNGVWVNHLNGRGWSSLGGDVKAISATADNTVYAIDGDNAVWVNSGSGWVDLGGDVKAISAGLGSSGFPEVYAIGGDNAAYVNSGYGWYDLGGYVLELAATTDGSVFARGELVNLVFVSSDRSGFFYEGSTPIADPQADTGYSTAPSGASLFNQGATSFLDVEQGAVGDCWLMASLAEVAARDPNVISSMFMYDGRTVDNGSLVAVYLVRLYSGNGTAFYVPVDTELPSGGGYYARVANALGTQALWVALAEKAYAEANSLGYVTSNKEYQDSYNALNDGDPAWALQAITGNSASDYSINPTNIAAAWDAGELVVLCTSTPVSSYIVGSHCYAVVGYNASSGESFEVFNPWGTQWNGYAPYTNDEIYGLFTANAAFISQNFSAQSIGTGAIDVNDIDRAVEELTELAALGNDSDPSGMIRSTRHGLTGSGVGAETSIEHFPGLRRAIS
jgi:hypothetical protein